MQILKGTPVSPGIVIGEAFLLDFEEFRMPRRAVEPEQIETEVARFHSAVDQVVAEISEDVKRLEAAMPDDDYHKIFEGHAMIVKDLVPSVVDAIRKYRF